MQGGNPLLTLTQYSNDAMPEGGIQVLTGCLAAGADAAAPGTPRSTPGPPGRRESGGVADPVL